VRLGRAAALFALLGLAACAREVGAGGVKAGRSEGSPPPALPPPPMPAPTPTPVPTPPPAPTQSDLSPAQRSELFRAQDACLNDCDQFACMKIAEAYRSGIGLPRDVLAGRRYAIHACLECGAIGLAIEDKCPLYGIAVPKKR
jgi:hypothetical protein